MLETRHFGMDAEIQAMEGNVPVLQMFDLTDLSARNFTYMDTQTLVVTHSLPSLDAGLAHHIPVVWASPSTSFVQIRSRRICRHPCRNDGSSTLV